MLFYQEMSKIYDDIFPLEPGSMDFFKSKLAGHTALLDIGCGTGNKTIEFKNTVQHLVGVDISPDMIDVAHKHHSAPNITYIHGDVLKLEKTVKPSSFDAAICLGNTLAHMNTPNKININLDAINRLLTPGGIFIIQILNYDRVVKQKITALPVLETDTVRFKREYKWEKDKIIFLTKLEYKQNGKTYENNAQLYPLLKSELTAALNRAGFTIPQYYGSFEGAPYTAESFITVAICTKLTA